MIEKHFYKICVFFLIIFSIEGAIWCWRLPKEFRSSIIPKMEAIIQQEKNFADSEDFLNHTHRYYDGHIKYVKPEKNFKKTGKIIMKVYNPEK